MTDEEKRLKIIKHRAQQKGYFLKMIISLITLIIFFNLAVKLDGVLSVLCLVMSFISIMLAFVFRMMHQGMLYCPLCGSSFGYGSWMTGSFPHTCPHCRENLNY